MGSEFYIPLLIGLLGSALLLFLIHFFGVRIRKTIEFSQNQFLASIITKSKAVLSFRNRLLFLFRTLALASLALSIYFFFEDNYQDVEKGIDSKIFLVDDSWSMMSALTDNTGTKLEHVAQIMQGFNSYLRSASIRTTSGISLIKDSVEMVAPNFYQSRSLFDNLDVSGSNKEFIVFSDWQRSTYPRELLKGLGNKAPLKIVNQFNKEQQNVFLDSVWLSTPVLLISRNIDIMARIAVSEPNLQGPVKVRLLDGDNQLGSSEVVFSNSYKEVVSFSIKGITHNDLLKLRLVVDDPSNTFDNQYFFVLPPSKQFNVAIVPVLRENNLILKALKQETGFNLINQVKKNGDSWIFQATGEITSSTKREVLGWLKNGNSLVIIPSSGSVSSIIDLMRELGVRNISARTEINKGLVLSTPDFSDPFFDDVFEQKQRRISMPTLFPVLQWQSSFHSILSFIDNSPFLSSFQVGGGLVHLFSAPIEGSEFATHPLFVPVLYQILLKSDPVGPLAFAADGKSIMIPAEIQRSESELLELRKGDNVFLPEQKWSTNGIELYLPKQLNAPGFYDIFLGKELLTTIGINIPSTESNLASYSQDELEEIFEDSKYPVEVIQSDKVHSLEKVLEKESQDVDLAKYCLILCLLLLLVEIFILRNRKGESPV